MLSERQWQSEHRTLGRVGDCDRAPGNGRCAVAALSEEAAAPVRRHGLGVAGRLVHERNA